jgi:hypothetical protein
MYKYLSIIVIVNIAFYCRIWNFKTMNLVDQQKKNMSKDG